MNGRAGLIGSIGRYGVLLAVVFSATYLGGLALTAGTADVNVVIPAVFGLLGAVAGSAGTVAAQAIANGRRDKANGGEGER